MIYLVDGFNLIYKLDDLEMLMYQQDLHEAMRGLNRRLRHYQAEQKRRPLIHIFYDGKKSKGDPCVSEELAIDLRAHYSHDQSADYLIKEFIKRHLNPGELLLVSSDKEVRHFAKRHKVRSQSSEEFAPLIEGAATNTSAQARTGRAAADESDEKPEAELNDEELHYWRSLFGSADNGSSRSDSSR